MDNEQKRLTRAMTLTQKLKAGQRLLDSARRLKKAALRSQHPDWTEDELERVMREMLRNVRIKIEEDSISIGPDKE